jgi:putative ABC transport system substrate-binding protein
VVDEVVTNLARPGGNVTGLSLLAKETMGKLLQLLKEAVPGASRLALLVKPVSVPERAMKGFLEDANVSALLEHQAADAAPEDG